MGALTAPPGDRSRFGHAGVRRTAGTATFLALSGSIALGCGASGGAARAPNSAARPESVSVPRTVITPERAASIPELYEHALGLARDGKHGDAALEFERIHDLDPTGDLADDALFQGASERDEAGELERAATDYEQLARGYPKSESATTALVRATRLFAYLERWQRAGELAERALAGPRELGPFERISVYAASALSRLEAGDQHAAQTFIEKGRDVIDEYRLDAAGAVPRELAALYFALGELRRRRSEQILFEPLPPDFADALERRWQLLLVALSAYSDAMRAYDAHWSAMAGYRVGELYERLHQDVMRIAPPAAADSEEKRRLFEAAMRFRYAVLLDKARQFMQHTLSMAERTGERSPWVDKTREALAEIQAANQREQAALAALPYSRATLEAGLSDLQRRAEEKAKAASAPSHGK
jgi:hypothetical protein